MSLKIDQVGLVKPTYKLPDELKLLDPNRNKTKAEIRWLRIEQIGFDQKTDIKERLESFFVSLWDQAFTFK